MTIKEFEEMVSIISDTYDWQFDNDEEGDDYAFFESELLDIEYVLKKDGFTIHLNSMIIMHKTSYNQDSNISEIEIEIDNCIKVASKYQNWITQSSLNLEKLKNELYLELENDFGVRLTLPTMYDLFESYTN